MGKYNRQYVDHDGETSTVGVNTIDLNAGNIAATLALFTTLSAAIDAVVIGTPRSESISAITTEIAGVLPVNGFAQRETKWLVQGVDSAGLTCTLEIPCADLDQLAGGTGELDITAGAGLALANALNAVWRSRAGNAVTVSRVSHVGRNI